MAKIPFNVSARTARLIGRENVANADGAIIELLKNGYDADADNLIIAFENDSLYIIDTGEGMTEEVIRKSWMTIGTDNKDLDPISEKRERIKSGAKGIGRFALDKLGAECEMYTLPEGDNTGIIWKINWEDFERVDTSINEVTADIESIPKMCLSNYLPNIVKSNKRINDLNFSNGTILKISKLRDSWDEKKISDLYENLELLAPPIDNFSTYLLSNKIKNPVKIIPASSDDFDFRISSTLDVKKEKLIISIKREEFDPIRLESLYEEIENSSIKKKCKIQKKDLFQDRVQEISFEELSKNNKIDISNLRNIGEFQFNFSFLKRKAPNKEDKKKYPYREGIDYSNKRSKWMNLFGGVKIFRDNFRVRPYGENGDDWLRLGERQTKSTAGAGQRLYQWRIRANQIIGEVYISRIKNGMLLDKSSREGIQENIYFEALKKIIIRVINEFERDRSEIMNPLFLLSDEKDEIEKKKREAEEVIKKNEASSDKTEEGNEKVDDKDKNHKEDFKKVAEGFKAQGKELEKKDEEIEILRALASSGIIMAGISHDLGGVEVQLQNRNNIMSDLLHKILDENNFAKAKSWDNPFSLLNDMKNSDKKLQEWIAHASSPLKKDRRISKKINLTEYFKNFHQSWKSVLENRGIKLEIVIKNNLYIKIIPLELDTIFNNLIINTLDNFRDKHPLENKIHIEVSSENQFNKIVYQDSGTGVSPYFKDPNDIFIPFESTKKNNKGEVVGTGLGMYLVKSAVEHNKGAIPPIINNKNGFKINILLPKYP